MGTSGGTIPGQMAGGLGRTKDPQFSVYNKSKETSDLNFGDPNLSSYGIGLGVSQLNQ
jgi:hypothetical protein